MFHSPGCQCCLPSSGGCCGCEVSVYYVSAPAISGCSGGCTCATGYYLTGGTLPMVVNASCIWSYNLGGGPGLVCCPSGGFGLYSVSFQLQCDATDMILLASAVHSCSDSSCNTSAVYKLARASWNCSGSNTLNKFSESGGCTWAATAVVAA